MNICDKCGKPVEADNDAVRLDCFAYPENGRYLLFAQSRHLFPTKDCAGSPSRAQYFEGQPRDTRRYEYVKEQEVLLRNAYKKMLETN